ncbi:MAG TPA: DUF6600 domain-containing protein [Burkholderiaceae bacterium]|nr:DUF6600 domain-containing protein [Burkholderiaceae bacterium]
MFGTALIHKTLRSPRPLATLLTATLLMVLALFSGGARAGDDDPPGRVGRVTESQGQAWVYDSDADEWIALQRNRPITSGSRIAVDGNARLELRVGSTTVRLAGASELEVRRLDDERIELFLLDGSAALRVRSQDVSREIEVSTPEGRFTPRRTGHYRIDHRDGSSVATAWNGELHFENDDSALDIGAGRSAEFWREANSTRYTWSESQSDEFADWVARANREDDRTGAVTRYVSPEMTGYEDLDRNGQWESHPEYGPVWAPTTVVAGWAPYRYGHWTWISPWGWTWVDDAPWGFAPFHYGRWVVVGGRWCWAPGRYVARPVYAPALVAWIGNVHVSAGAPVVGWVPLAPREPYYPHYARGGGYWKSVNSAHLHLFPSATPRTIPTRAIRYANQGAPGGLSAVPSTALVSRRPIAPAVAQIDPSIRNNLSNQQWRPHVPPPGVARTIAVPRGNQNEGHGATPSPAGRPGLPPGMRSPAGTAQQPPAATVAREPREQIPRPMRPPQAAEQATPRSVSPQVRSEAVPQLQTPARPAAQPSPPEARRAPIPGPEVHRIREPQRTPPPARPEVREPPRSQVHPDPTPRAAMPAPAPRAAMPAPAPRAAMPAPAPRPAMPQQPAQVQREAQQPPQMQRDVPRGRAPEARARIPEQQRGQGREQMR